MSSMRQRLQLYSVLPKVRSNSISTLTVSAPTSTSRPVLSSPPRFQVPSEAPKQSQHSQLALSQPTPGLNPPLFPATPLISPNFSPVPSTSPSPLAPPPADSPRAHKRQRLRYQLDVGAYGIAKQRTQSRSFHSTSTSTSTYPHTSLSVQVGEDAYFVRDNAMGIADGVGGWSRSVPTSSQHPTPSALFSRRLMHFCSAEIEALESPDILLPNPSHRPPTAPFSFQHHLKPRPTLAPLSSSSSSHDPFSFADLEDSLHSSLEELSEGIDILNILERAYDSTVKSHLAPSAPTPTPLTTGSSTALLAVLDHPPSGPLPQSPESPHKNYAVGSLYSPDLSPPKSDSNSQSQSDSSEVHAHALSKGPYDAVVRIAHLGDCMGMLIRKDTIVWRSDEMWWGYNHPLQLGPPSASSFSSSSSSSKPTNPNRLLSLPVKPHTFTLPVRADDILILASDGLSDNLWDEDVLDEVLKFRRQQNGFPFHPASASASGQSESHPNESLKAQILRRKAFAGMLSEALCSRAKRVSDTRPSSSSSSSSSSSRRRTASPPPHFNIIPEEEEPQHTHTPKPSVSLVTSNSQSVEDTTTNKNNANDDEDMLPFAHRAKLAGKSFRGGKHDDISVIVAIISPSHSAGSADTRTPSPTSSASVSTSSVAGSGSGSASGSASSKHTHTHTHTDSRL